MNKLGHGMVKFNKQQIRRIGEGFGGYIKDARLPLSCVDKKAAQEAGKRKTYAISMDRSKPRDLLLYN